MPYIPKSGRPRNWIRGSPPARFPTLYYKQTLLFYQMSASNYTTYSIEDVNNSVRKTNSLLRSLNAVRTLVHTLQETMRSPSIDNIFWSLVQISRIYNTLKRLNRLIQEESNISLGFIKGLGSIPVVDTPDIPDLGGGLGSMDLSLRVEAFRDNIPMGLEGLDLSNLPESSQRVLQEIFEDDAEMTVMDARQMLRERIMHPESSTGNLEHSIGWRAQTNGTQIYADAYYAWWTEVGHQTFLGHHFLKDATERARVRLPLRIKAELDALIKEETSK